MNVDVELGAGLSVASLVLLVLAGPQVAGGFTLLWVLLMAGESLGWWS